MKQTFHEGWRYDAATRGALRRHGAQFEDCTGEGAAEQHQQRDSCDDVAQSIADAIVDLITGAIPLPEDFPDFGDDHCGQNSAIGSRVVIQQHLMPLSHDLAGDIESKLNAAAGKVADPSIAEGIRAAKAGVRRLLVPGR